MDTYNEETAEMIENLNINYRRSNSIHIRLYT